MEWDQTAGDGERRDVPSADHNPLKRTDRGRLVRFLMRRTSLDELKGLAFDLGAEHTLFAVERKNRFCRELIAYAERKNLVACLVRQLLARYDEAHLEDLDVEEDAVPQRAKLQVELCDTRPAGGSGIGTLLDELDARLGLGPGETTLVAAAWKESDPIIRACMVKDLLGSFDFEGMTVEEVRSLLGEPDRESEYLDSNGRKRAAMEYKLDRGVRDVFWPFGEPWYQFICFEFDENGRFAGVNENN